MYGQNFGVMSESDQFAEEQERLLHSHSINVHPTEERPITDPHCHYEREEPKSCSAICSSFLFALTFPCRLPLYLWTFAINGTSDDLPFKLPVRGILALWARPIAAIAGLVMGFVMFIYLLCFVFLFELWIYAQFGLLVLNEHGVYVVARRYYAYSAPHPG